DTGSAAAPALAVELADDVDAPAGMAFDSLRRLHAQLDATALPLAVRGVHIVEWDRGNQFCGRCGGATERVAVELAKTCPRCRAHVHSPPSPAGAAPRPGGGRG